MKRFALLTLFALPLMLSPVRACNVGFGGFAYGGCAPAYNFALPYQVTYLQPVVSVPAVVATQAPVVQAPVEAPMTYAAAPVGLPAYSVATYGSIGAYNQCVGLANLFGVGYVNRTFFREGRFFGFDRFGAFGRGFSSVNVNTPFAAVNVNAVGGGRRTRAVVRQRRGRTVTRVRTR